jgi:acyl-CoA dehydrogenase
MRTPGVTTKPIKLISGSSPFCETFFDNVKVPKDNLIGGLNQGWTIAKYLLTHEREMIGGFGIAQSAARSFGEMALNIIGQKNGELADSGLRSEITNFEVDELAFALTAERVVAEAKAGHGTGAASSLLKYYGTELNKTRYELSMAVGGPSALAWDDPNGVSLSRAWLRTKGNSIEGGTSEVQLNIIAKQILGL